MDYRTSFVGIPLPEEYLEDFVAMTEQVKDLILHARIVDLATPHVTFFFLGNQSENSLKKIAAFLEKKKEGLAGDLKIGQAGHFGRKHTRVLFLKAEGENLRSFYHTIAAELSKYREPEREIFEPHLTVCRLKGEGAREFRQNQELIEKLFSQEWEFPVHEIALYGINPAKKPYRQEKLHSIEL